MDVLSTDSSSVGDPLLPWLLSIKSALDKKTIGEDLRKLLLGCITTFKHNTQYQNDPRFLKIWFLHEVGVGLFHRLLRLLFLFFRMDGSNDPESVFREMEENNICRDNSLLYELYAGFLEATGKWQEAYVVFELGILRKAKPLERLNRSRSLFLSRMSHWVNASSFHKINGTESMNMEKYYCNPWHKTTVEELLKKINAKLTKYDGYHPSNKSGGSSLSSLRNAARNKIVKIGGRKYQIKGRAGQGGFGLVLKAHVDCNPDDMVALKIQVLSLGNFTCIDSLISELQKSKSSFGVAYRVHQYSEPDHSILICDYLPHGTLQDVINSYVVTGKPIEEVVCIYYTIQMLQMLETLHDVGIIHGDFKPDNLLIRNSRDNLTEEGFHDKSGPWKDQFYDAGSLPCRLGRGIDLCLFPEETEFKGDCRTSGFRCIEMQEDKPWKFQVDTYGLCVVVHMMLHNSYMEIEKKTNPDGCHIYLPKSPFRRYWIDLWKNLFTQLLNNGHGSDKFLLQSLKKSFQDYLLSDPKLVKQLIELLAKQRQSLCSA